MRIGRVLVLVAGVASAALAFTAIGAGQDGQRPAFTVAPGGDDAGPGTPELPWRTISHAARAVPAGSLVDIRAGTYAERVVVGVSGAPDNPTTFRAHPGERVTISGTGLRGLRGGAGLIHVRDRSNLEFVGLELRDLVDNRNRFVPAGVWITGASSNITLRELNIHRIRTTGGDAHAIAVYGTSGSSPVSGVTITGNNVHDLKLGSSEAIAINGNVDGWIVAGNTVDNVDNIGIDAIGYERTAPRNDRARNGVIADNAVSDVNTRGNSAYEGPDGNCFCAGGIYVDGGYNIVVERNRVTRSNLGIELASEARRGSTSDVVVRNNLVTFSGRAGLTMGGYDTKRGKTERVRVVNNTFVNNDRLRGGVGEITLNYRLLDSSVLNNVIRAGSAGIMVTNGYRQNSRNVFDGNVWFAKGKGASSAIWYWRNVRAKGFAAWRAATRSEASSRYADPKLAPDGRPLPGSAVIDAGVSTPFSGDGDLVAAPRQQGTSVDAGAYETAP